MDFQNYQKMFPSTPHQNGFPLMNYFPPQFQQQQQHSYHQHQQQQQSMMNSMFNNQFMSKPMNYGNHHHQFMGGQQHHHQRKTNNFQLPPPSAFCLPPYASTSAFNPTSSAMMMPNNASPLSSSTNGSSTKEETPREIFFRTLSSSLKEANKFYSGKTTSWKNPFLYKTHLCENFGNRQYCRFGVNCWYAHGPHELRCIPESDDLPDPVFIIQYLSFLGLPSQTLEQIIQYAYYVANLLTSSESPWFSSSKKSSPDLPSFDSTRSVSASNSPIHNSPSDSEVVTPPEPINNTIPKRDKFYSSYLSNGGGWSEIENALNCVVGQTSEFSQSRFGGSFRLFGESYNLQKP